MDSIVCMICMMATRCSFR